jgi:hypothetical protein
VVVRTVIPRPYCPEMRRLDVDTQEIVRLYVEEGLRGAAIADRLGCTPSIVYSRLESAGVRRSRRARLHREEVVSAYLGGESCLSIGRRAGVAAATVARHLRSWGVAMRTHAEALQPVGRVPCPKSRELRAYLLGFAWGDLAVQPPQGRGITVGITSSTTHEAQVDLIRSAFEPFGKVYVFTCGSVRSLRVSLDSSFRFLLAKYGGAVPPWVAGPTVEAAFAAGYIDAEGSFGVYDGRARFKLDSCDHEVHSWLHAWLDRVGVPFVGRVVERCGERPNGLRLNRDLHRINVNDALGLARLVATIDPFARHERRRATMAAAVQNVVDRMRARAAP